MYNILEDHIVSVTDLKRRTKHWLDVARHQAPVTVAQGSQADLVIVRRSDEATHLRLLRYAQQFARFTVDQNQGTRPADFPWYELLDPEEKREFLKELRQGFLTMMQSGEWQAFAELLHDWQATAEANTNPDLLAALTAPERPEEYIVAERPGEQI